MKKRFTEEQIVHILRDAEIPGVQIREVCRKHNVTEQTFFRWRIKYGGLDVADTRRLRNIESVNARLKKLVVEQALVTDTLARLVRLHGKLRDECLAREWFRDLREARILIEHWRHFYGSRIL